MPDIALALDDGVALWVKADPEIGWSEVARQAKQRRLEDLGRAA